MPTPSQIIGTVAALMNDAAQTEYTNAACLPYLNIALDILQETFELNGLPVTNKTSAVIVVPSGTAYIGFSTTPALPYDLIEIQQLWESDTGLNRWIPMVKKEFIPSSLRSSSLLSQFFIWAWKNQFIEILPASADIDIKLDYIASIFATPITIANINGDLLATNIKTYLEFETGALCALFIGENESRARALEGLAGNALDRALGIPIKGMQSIVTRRLPFRSGFKSRGQY